MCDTPSNCYYHKDFLQLIDLIEKHETELKTIKQEIETLQKIQATNSLEITQLTKTLKQTTKTIGDITK